MWLLLAACTAEGPGAGSEAEIRRDVERRMVHATEVAVLWRTATQALAEGRPTAAAAAVALGIEVDPERFQPLVDAVASTADAQALAVLATRVDRERFEGRAQRAEVDSRYAPEVLGATRARWAGVDRRRGARILAGVDAEYVVEPDHARMLAAVDRRLTDLAESAVVRAAFPAWRGAPPGGDGVLGRIDAAVAGGLPEPFAVGEGIGAALGALDPYTLPVWPASLAGWEQHHAGASVGIGVELAAADGGIVVTMPTVGGPAWTAGIHAGDALIAVDGEALPADTPVDGALGRLGGEEGTEVEVSVARDGGVRTFRMARATVREETVRGWVRAGDGWDVWVEPGIAWLRITAFRPHTDEELDALIPDEPARAVILDLRGNGGGDVMAAVNVADRFVDHGDVAYLEGRTLSPPVGGPNGEVPWNVAIPGHPLEGVPVVVLVDGDTASASELVAGALRELAGAALVGDDTYGKGLSQALRVDEELGVGWQVTDGTWLLPSRKALEAPGGQRTGLAPDTRIALSPAERLQVQALRRKRELPPAHPDGSPVPDLGTVARSELPRLTDDPQAVAALQVARIRLGR